MGDANRHWVTIEREGGEGYAYIQVLHLVDEQPVTGQHTRVPPGLLRLFSWWLAKGNVVVERMNIY